MLAITLSSDGTTHKSIQYSSRHAVAIPENGDPPKDRFLGVTPEKGRTGCKTKCDHEEEQATGEAGGVVSGGRIVGKFSNGGGDHEYIDYFTAESGR